MDALTTPIGFAHRGARAHAPENTIEAFLMACRMGATALETDVWLSRDGIVVIDHDGRIGPRWRARPIASAVMSALPGHFPALESLCQIIGPTTDLSIDVKDPKAIHGIIQTRGRSGSVALRHTWICDADVERLVSWRALDPDVRLVASLRRRHLASTSFPRLSARGIAALNLPHRTWTPALVEACHGAGLWAFAWGVQRPRRMHTLLDWGIDALYSDHTDRLVDALRTHAERI